jgi:hypothetical protein
MKLRVPLNEVKGRKLWIYVKESLDSNEFSYENTPAESVDSVYGISL